MEMLSKERTPLEGVMIIQPRVFSDLRGYFFETFNNRRWQEYGIATAFVQDNESKSKRGVLRGLHFQLNHPQAKLVRVSVGCIYDVVVDVRPESRTFGKWIGIELSEENKRQIFIPEGFAHGFLTQSSAAIVCYKVSEYYYPDDERCIIWNDKDLGIIWPGVKEEAFGSEETNTTLFDGSPLIISEKDSNGESWSSIIHSML